MAGCKSDDSLNAPNVIDPMFRRYAALGNSITAGFQSLGINDSTQRRAYPALLAAAMGTSFTFPTLSRPGCPPPFTNNVTQARVGNGTATTCAGNAVPRELLNNLGVPGQCSRHAVEQFQRLPVAVRPAQDHHAGGRTEVELMMQLKPTFVTDVARSNDVLGPDQRTNPAIRTGDRRRVHRSIRLAGGLAPATGPTWSSIRVPDVTAIPFASLGAIWYCLKNGGVPTCTPAPQIRFCGTPDVSVARTCAPPDGGKPSSLDQVSQLGAALQGSPSTIDCRWITSNLGARRMADGRPPYGYNQHIQRGPGQGWGTSTSNRTLQPCRALRQLSSRPVTQSATGHSSSGLAVLLLDGVHPSSAASGDRGISIASVINQTYGTSLPVPICVKVTCPPP
jgi:hypothetical protein